MKLKTFASTALLSLATAGFVATPALASDELTIVETAIATDGFSSLVAAVTAAGLVETLSSDGPFTVFAPTDEAFAALPEETLAYLLSEEGKEDLTAILLYHVVPGEVLSSDLAGQALSAETAGGIAVDIDATMGNVIVGGATVVAADVETSNGVIHVIDTVILPPES